MVIVRWIMKKKSIIFGILTVLLCLFCFTACTENNEKITFSYDNADKFTAETTEYNDYISDLEVIWLSGSVKVVTGEVTGVVLSETASKDISEDYKVRSYLDSDKHKLYVAFSKIGKIDISNLSKDLTVTVSKEMALKNVTVKSVTADVELANSFSYVSAFSAETVSGKVKAEFTANTPVNFDVKTVTGDVIATFTRETSPLIDIETVSGKVNIVAMDLRDVEFKSVSGGLTLTLPDSVGYTATLKSIAGKITSEYGDTKYGDGKARITAETVSGNVEIKKSV